MRGLIGMLLLPVFIAFINIALGVHIEWEYLHHIALAGYVGGSLGIEILMAQDDARYGAEATPPPNSAPALPHTHESKAAGEPAPFRYASWDDEEESR